MSFPWISSLRVRFILVGVVVYLLTAAGVYWVYQGLVNGVIHGIGVQLIEQQVRYDRTRGQGVLSRELTLALKLADSPILRHWISDEGNPQLKKAAMEELESFRSHFSDRSYFLAIRNSGAYYYNAVDNKYPPDQPRYLLEPYRLQDRWFFTLLKSRQPYLLNVDHDPHLDVTKVWFNVVIRNARGESLAVAGTGLDLTPFLQTVVRDVRPGVLNMMTDESGAIQAHPNPDRIDFQSLNKRIEDRVTIFRAMKNPEEVQQLRQRMKALRDQPGQVGVLEATVDGIRYLIGIAYLPEIGWYNFTLMEREQLVNRETFQPMLVLVSVAMLLDVLMIQLLFQRLVVTRLVVLERSTRDVATGNFSSELLPGGNDEIGRLSGAFRQMADNMRDYTGTLEREVQNRTEALHKISISDPLTGLFNRRGIEQEINAEYLRSQRSGTRIGILLVDLDHFKQVNDNYGHAAGDRLLVEMAGLLRHAVRGYDRPARWGGDEFLVLLPECDEITLQIVAERVRREASECEIELERGSLNLTFSLGGALSLHGESIEQLIARADEAMYRAKRGGRNRFCMAETPPGPSAENEPPPQ